MQAGSWRIMCSKTSLYHDPSLLRCLNDGVGLRERCQQKGGKYRTGEKERTRIGKGREGRRKDAVVIFFT